MKNMILGLAVLVSQPLALAKKPDRPAITMAAAKKTALATVAGGVLKSAELEKEKGKLIYSFDVIAADKQIVEVNVDAMNGSVLTVEHESAAKEASEEKAERAHAKP